MHQRMQVSSINTNISRALSKALLYKYCQNELLVVISCFTLASHLCSSSTTAGNRQYKTPSEKAISKKWKLQFSHPWQGSSTATDLFFFNTTECKVNTGLQSDLLALWRIQILYVDSPISDQDISRHGLYFLWHEFVFFFNETFTLLQHLRKHSYELHWFHCLVYTYQWQPVSLSSKSRSQMHINKIQAEN